MNKAKEIENTLTDIDKVKEILKNNKVLYNKDFIKYLKHKRVQQVFKLYNLTHFKTHNNITDLIKDHEKKAVYIQIKHDIYIYIDFDRDLVYCLADAPPEETITTTDNLEIVEGDDITTIEARRKISKKIREAMKQP